MPKRQKTKVRTTPKPTEKIVSAAKQARIDKQEKAAAINQMHGYKPWQVIKHKRHQARKAAGKTYENWRKANSARYSEDTKPTASNLLVE